MNIILIILIIEIINSIILIIIISVHLPVSSLYAVTPSDHQSTAHVYPDFSELDWLIMITISGAMYLEIMMMVIVMMIMSLMMIMITISGVIYLEMHEVLLNWCNVCVWWW